MHFVGLGHSHIVALAKGAYALAAQSSLAAAEALTCRFCYLYDPQYEPPFVAADDGRQLNPGILAAIRDGAPRFILTSIGGNEHNVLSIAQRDGRFDFILGENPELALDRQAKAIPEAAIRETLRDWMADKTDILRALRAATDVPIVQIEPPPPLPRKHVLAYPKEFFRSLLDQRNLSPDLLRYKMWRVQSGILRDLCGDLGVMYVETPPDMIDGAGMLAAKAWGKDATHANDHYGEAMVASALRRVLDIPGRG